MLKRPPSVIRLPDGPVLRRPPALRIFPFSIAGKVERLVRSRRARRRAVALQAAMALVLSSPLFANAPPSSGLEALGQRVADEKLGEMRGKFVRSGDISYFGISMATSWQDANNITTSAILLFAVDFLPGGGFAGSSGNPVVAVAWNRDCAGCADPAMDVVGFGPAAENGYVAVTSSSQVLPVGGLDTVEGAVQSQQIAGLGNNATNAMQIAVVPTSAARQMGAAELQSLSQSSVETFADGSSLGFMVGANELGIAMSSADGRSSIRQSVSGALNQAAQHVLLNDNLNSVHNSMTITVGVDSLAQADRVQIEGALSAMKDRF